MHLLRHITQKTPCPNCKEPIFPEQIRVDTSTEDSALLTIHCEFCEHDLHVHVFVNMTDPEIEQEHTVKENDISMDELAEAHKILDGFDGDIGSLFEIK